MKTLLVVLISVVMAATALAAESKTEQQPPELPGGGNIQQPAAPQEKQKAPGGNIKPGRDSVKEDSRTLESLKVKQKWNYGKDSCGPGGCTTKEENSEKKDVFDAGGKVVYEDVARAVGAVEAPVVVAPEIPVAVRLSARDINRVTCQGGEIRDIVYSKEKGMIVSFSGKDAFIKYKYIKKDKETIFPAVTEMFIVCGESTYNLIAVPEKIPSVTVQLSSRVREAIKKNNALFNGMASEKKIILMIRALYMDDLPESFTVRKRGSVDVSPFRELSVVPGRTVAAEGEGLEVDEYRILLRDDYAGNEIDLTERDFLPMLSDVTALALDKSRLKKGESARLFVCRQSRGMSEKEMAPTIKIDRGYVNEEMKKPDTVNKEKKETTSGPPAGSVKKQYKMN